MFYCIMVYVVMSLVYGNCVNGDQLFFILQCLDKL